MEYCTIRYASAEDYAQVEDLLQKVQALHVGWRPGRYKRRETVMTQEQFETLAGYRRILVAEAKNHVVGMLSFEFRHVNDPAQYSQHVVHIDAMAVHEKHRRRGVGRMLFDRVWEISKANLFEGVEVEVDAKNILAYDMFLHFGLQERTVTLEMRRPEHL